MKPRAVLGAAILAGTLALSTSCKTPLVEGPASLRTSQHHAQRPHPCATHVIKGGIPTSCHVLFQIHKISLTRETSKNAVRSQILLYRVISDLIKNHGVDVVLLEGVDISEDASKALLSKCDEKCSSIIQDSIKGCILDVTSIKVIRAGLFELLAPVEDEAEDFCLAKVLLHSYRLADMTKVLLMLSNPSVLFTGFERDSEKRFEELKKLRVLLRLKEAIGPLFNPHAGKVFEGPFISFYNKLAEERLRYVDKDAINGALSYSSKNTALVIGVGHKELIEEAIKAVPFAERPTFYFVMPKCHGSPAFSVSPEAIKLAIEATPKNR